MGERTPRWYVRNSRSGLIDGAGPLLGKLLLGRLRLTLRGFAAAAFLLASASLVHAQSADAPAGDDRTGAWYVVGDLGEDMARGQSNLDGFAGFDDRLVVGEDERRRVTLGLTFSNAEADRTLSFTAPTPASDADGEDRFTFLVSGAYDWHTGTIVTPRFMAGVGISYLDPDVVPARIRQDGTGDGDLAPAMQVGIGADVAISGTLDLSAEYRASVRGATETGRAESDPQVDQKFMIGARIRF